jgi:hypothetical protein
VQQAVQMPHVERLAGINKILYKSVILLELFLELIHDARNDEHKSIISVTAATFKALLLHTLGMDSWKYIHLQKTM